MSMSEERKFKKGDIVERTCECCKGDRLKVLGYNDEGMVVYEMNDQDGCAFENELRLIGQQGNPKTRQAAKQRGNNADN